MKGKKVANRIIWILVFAGIAVWFFRYNQKKIRYVKNTLKETYEPELSTLYFPVYLSVDDLQKLANQKLRKVLVNKVHAMDNRKDSLDVKIIRTGDLEFHLKDEKIYAFMPLRAEISVIRKVGEGTMKFFRNNPLTFEAGVYATVLVNLDEKIRIKANSTITEIRWKQEPEVKIAGIRLNVKRMVEKNLEEQLPELTDRLNDIIRDKINLRKTIDRIWTKLQYNKCVDKKDREYVVKIQPWNLSVHVDKTMQDSLRLNLMVKSKLYLRHVSDTAGIKKIPLPEKINVLKKYSSENESKIYLHALVPLHILNETLCRALNDKKLNVKGTNVRIKSIDLVTGKDCMVGDIDVYGDVNGRIRIKGLPVFSKEKEVITVEKLELESKLDEELINTAAGLFINEILFVLNQQSTINTGELFKKLPGLARDELQKSKLTQKADVTLRELEINDVQLKLTEHNIQLLIEASPDFEIAVKKEGLKIRNSAR